MAEVPDMRVSKEKAAENRERILAEAARLFRERGLGGVGVDALAEAAGLSYGALYSQFGSKERLATEALRHALDASASRAARVPDLASYADRYLSPAHRDAPGDGCAIAALACEIPRQGEDVRHAFTEGVRRMQSRIRGQIPQAGPAAADRAALGIAATMIGALILARAVDDPTLSEQILAAGRERVDTLTGD
jgi:TetR/AcrR family transcriptional repressor of nem operon